MFARLRSRNSAITFDVGASGVRAFQATARGPRIESRDSMHLTLPSAQHGADAKPTPPDYSRLSRLVGQGNFDGRDVALVLSPPDIRFCTLRLPKKALEQPEEKVREALAWEVAREMRAEAHELEVRHWPLPSGHHQGLNVMAVALPIERALGWHSLFAAQNLRLRRIDVSPCAITHLARRVAEPEPKDVWGVLDLGSRSTTLTVVLGETPVYIRTLNASADRWTQKLAEAFEVSQAGAEQLKRKYGIYLGDRGVRMPERETESAGLMNAPDIPGVVFNLLREPLNDLIHEVSRCLAYVLQNFSDANATRLYLAGGGANLPGLAEYLGLQLDMQARVLTNLDPQALQSEREEPATVAPASDWTRPLGGTPVRPEAASVIGGAMLDLEIQ